MFTTQGFLRGTKPTGPPYNSHSKHWSISQVSQDLSFTHRSCLHYASYNNRPELLHPTVTQMPEELAVLQTHLQHWIYQVNCCCYCSAAAENVHYLWYWHRASKNISYISELLHIPSSSIPQTYAILHKFLYFHMHTRVSDFTHISWHAWNISSFLWRTAAYHWHHQCWLKELDGKFPSGTASLLFLINHNTNLSQSFYRFTQSLLHIQNPQSRYHNSLHYVW